MKIKVYVLLLIMILPSLAISRIVTLQNDYLKASVDDLSGHFYLETVKGDPNKPGDDNRLLLYRKIPPTSYASFNINGENFDYGGEKGYFKQRPKLENNKIVSEWSVRGIVVKQVIQLVKNPTTGRNDAMRLFYKIKNENRRKTKVGMRLLYDTCLGDKDGTPFQVPGVGLIDKETQLYRTEMPKYWYSFDNNDNPVVRTMGILQGNGVTRPDKIVFASWNRLLDNPWDFPVNGDKDLRTTGTGHYDSAVAQYYEPLSLKKNETMYIYALYGLYGASFFSSKDLSLSLAVPAEPSEPPVTVSVQVKNKGKQTLDKLTMTITPPDGFTLGNGQNSTVEYLKVGPGETKQGLWELNSKSVKGDFEVQVSATGFLNDNKQSVQAAKKFTMNYKPMVTVIKDTNEIRQIQKTAVEESQQTNTVNIVQTNNVTNETVTKVNETNNAIKTAVKKENVVSPEEQKLLDEISDLDKLIKEIDGKYELLMEVYRNSYQTNQNTKSFDLDLENYKARLSEEEAVLSNEIKLYGE